MKSIILVVGLVLVAQAAAKIIPIVEQTIFNDNKGTYSVDVLTGDGTRQKEVGSLRPKDKELVTEKSGSYSWTTPEGKVLTVSYVADELGFRAVGDHLPVAPEIPEAIKQMLLTLPKLTEAELYDGLHDLPKPLPPHHPPPFAPASPSISIVAAPQQQFPKPALPVVTPAPVPSMVIRPPQQGVSLAEELAPALGSASSTTSGFNIIEAPLVNILAGPKKTLVESDGFSIHSDNNGRTLLRIGA